MAGTLYVVATPLGHLGDLTARAADTLRRVPVVAAEDTRRARKLLAHLDTRPRIVSYHAHSKPRTLRSLLALLESDTDVALVTDAGTPGISDPGAALVEAAAEAGLRIVPIPGPSAVATALSASGIPADRYLFLGFLPRGGPERRRRLEEIANSPWTVVLFESAQRLSALLTALRDAAGPERRAVVAREVTKVHEEFRRGTLGSLAGYYAERPVRGEVTVVVQAGAGRAGATTPATDAAFRARELLQQGLSRRDAALELAREYQWTRNAAYRFVAQL